IAVENVKGAGWSGAGIDVRSTFVPGTFKLDGKLARLEVDRGWPLYPQLQQVFPPVESPWTWKDIIARVDVHATGGVIQQITARDPIQTWRLRGDWVRDGRMSGMLSVGAARAKSFALNGEKGLLAVEEVAAR
ncbi:MAG TPA: hypothetical protein PKC28_02960, partial [Bdellovibrionales bacterium]|nr:hypothetical protein [Bdellovibrionales bacterium]